MLRKRLGRGALGGLLLVAFLSPATSSAQDLDDLREEQRRIEASAARAAADVDALEADASDVSAALDALRAHVSRQQDAVASAQEAEAAAEAEVAAAEQRLAGIQAEQTQARADIRLLLVRAYVGDGLGASGASLFSFNDISTAERERAYVDAQFGTLDDLRDKLRALEEDAEIAREEREEALADAEEQHKLAAEELADLEEAESLQAEVVDAAEARLDQRLAEAAALADQDAELSQSIQSEEAEIARQLAAQAAASRSTNGGGGGGGGFNPTGEGEIVSVAGIEVHRSIADNVGALLAAAAADGVPLGGWGYRSSQRQIELRRQNCGPSDYDIYEAPSSACSPPTARPGSSMHERGLAIDFTYGGNSIQSRSNPGYQWLAAHAAGFGLYNLPSEPWHWSTTGS